MSETSVKRGPVSGLGRIRRGDTDLFGGAFTIRSEPATGCIRGGLVVRCPSARNL